MPVDTPGAIVLECRAFGAEVHLIDGLISDCGAFIAKNAPLHGWYEVSTLKEPCRIEGKKTMGYELWEELKDGLPDVIVYPTGGGVGLIGMWKAFEELEAMGLIGQCAASNDRGAGRRVRANRPRVRAAARVGIGDVGERGDRRGGPARCRSRSAIS